MPKITLNIDEDKFETFVAFLQTLPYVSIDQESSSENVKEKLKELGHQPDYNSSDVEDINEELSGLFGE